MVERRREQRTEQRTDPVDPVVPREAAVDHVRAQRSRGVQGSTGIIVAYIGKSERQKCNRSFGERTNHFRDEERQADTDRSQVGRLVLDNGQHNHHKDQLRRQEHLNKQALRDRRRAEYCSSADRGTKR